MIRKWGRSAYINDSSVDGAYHVELCDVRSTRCGVLMSSRDPRWRVLKRRIESVGSYRLVLFRGHVLCHDWRKGPCRLAAQGGSRKRYLYSHGAFGDAMRTYGGQITVEMHLSELRFDHVEFH